MNPIRRIKQIAKRGLYAAMGLGRDIRARSLTVNPENQGWTICPDHLTSESVVYSLGLGDNISFDLGLIERFGLTVHGFDPTPRSLDWLKNQEIPARLVIHPVGVAGHEGTLSLVTPLDAAQYSYVPGSTGIAGGRTVEVPVKKLSTIMRELGHNRLDLLKMDIEGAEYEVIDEIVSKNIAVSQILVEFHHRFSGIGIGRTLHAMRVLRKAGFKVFHVSEWCEEYALLKAP